jgi:phospholipid/cholesterol/gamma-HCH transport system ATP-binding protein
MMQELTALLEFREVTIRAGAVQAIGIRGVNLSLGRGEMAVIAVEEGRECLPLAPLAQGLLTPDAGEVIFNGENWREAGPGKQSLMRGRTRRVFEHYGWVTNLDMIENVCLAEYHHTQRPIEQIKQEATGLARRFGLDGVPDARPTRVHPMILRKLEWVRAFVGAPELIILERPLAGAPKADAPLLISALCEAVKRGVAVMWISDDLRVINGPELAGARHFRMEGDKMMMVENKKGVSL